MKKIILVLILSCITVHGFAKPAYRENMQNYLKKNPVQQNSQPRVLSFHFDEIHLNVLKNLLAIEKKVTLIVDSDVDMNHQFPLHLRNSNFFEFLDVTTRQLGLQYEVLNSKTIRVYK
ncbi:hypothetical protein [Acinetobacter indicus]|uniref:Uncharacterized protein n=1 Tax=Acinetobacter indicus TaxID=756892 RepID=A0A6C0Y4W2_9GAMM|nr:hypothetical protein [Acinetobacter indicus]QIC71193.1 hypothetical protein FSC09_12660 [Acinetobacter indicus]